jgi:uncharacterized FlaG/YvyC family protein
MAQLSVTPLPAVASTAPVNPTSAKERALNVSIAVAVKTLNSAGYAGDGREVTFSFDQATRRPIIRVVDTATKEVLHQWPPEYLLQLAADTNKLTRDSG